MEKQGTRQKILAEGARLVHCQGFNNTGIQQILKAAGVPKGSFYFYFKSKEEFGLALIDFFIQFFRDRALPRLHESGIPPLQRMLNFFDFMADFFSEHSYQMGCPIGNLAQELGDVNEPMRQRLATTLDGLESHFHACLTEARSTGDLPETTDVREYASFLLNSWEGALLRMKVCKSGEPLDLFRKMVIILFRLDEVVSD